MQNETIQISVACREIECQPQECIKAMIDNRKCNWIGGLMIRWVDAKLTLCLCSRSVWEGIYNSSTYTVGLNVSPWSDTYTHFVKGKCVFCAWKISWKWSNWCVLMQKLITKKNLLFAKKLLFLCENIAKIRTTKTKCANRNICRGWEPISVTCNLLYQLTNRKRVANKIEEIYWWKENSEIVVFSKCFVY